jgi:hypothetical protein
VAELGSFLKKETKDFAKTGFGLSAEAQPECVKVFWFLFSKKNRFLFRPSHRVGGSLAAEA